MKSNCSVTCGGGIQSYKRRCRNPSPNDIGTSCVGESNNEEECNENNCYCKFVKKKYILTLILDIY